MNKEYEYCLRCHRRLKNKEARLRGYGLICYNKSLVEHDNRLFRIKENKK